MQDDTSGLSLLRGGSLPAPAGGPKREMLETFPNRFARLYMVAVAFPEYTSLCPVTGQPDFGTIAVEYVPAALCVESKSFKLYMFAYRNSQTFMETVSNRILDDLVAVLNPHWCRVRGLFAPRGGVKIDVYAEHYGEESGKMRANVEQFVRSWLIQPDPARLP